MPTISVNINIRASFYCSQVSELSNNYPAATIIQKSMIHLMSFN